jgi:hypothetical protein
MKLNMLAPMAACTSMPARLRQGTSRTPPIPMQPINNPDRRDSVATRVSMERVAEPTVLIANTNAFV